MSHSVSSIVEWSNTTRLQIRARFSSHASQSQTGGGAQSMTTEEQNRQRRSCSDRGASGRKGRLSQRSVHTITCIALSDRRKCPRMTSIHQFLFRGNQCTQVRWWQGEGIFVCLVASTRRAADEKGSTPTREEHPARIAPQRAPP